MKKKKKKNWEISILYYMSKTQKETENWDETIGERGKQTASGVDLKTEVGKKKKKMKTENIQASSSIGRKQML